jgi:alanyl-tRNA synthetase
VLLSRVQARESGAKGGGVTERLYYDDSFVHEFDALVVSCERDGDRWRARLDRTVFYPTSGGQPHDTGTLGGASVVEVADAEDGGIVHYLSAELPPGPIHGTIDWARRFDHMQQHTGQHLLSAVFIELLGFQTVSFHLGKEICTIDLETPCITPENLSDAERRVNELIFEDRVVSVTYGTAQELAEAGVRKQVDREGILRAVEIQGVDRQPCGGTHLARTGQAGLVLLRKMEKRRNAWRVEFVCGGRALAAARGDYDLLTHAANLLSCGLPDVPELVAKTLDERRALQSAAKRMESRLAELESQALLARAGWPGADTRLIVAAIEDASPAYLTQLAARLAAESGIVAFLGSRSGGHVVFAQSKGSAGDMGALLREALRKFPGKGGGGKDFAQGALADPTQIEAALADAKRSVAAG